MWATIEAIIDALLHLLIILAPFWMLWVAYN